jgi:hypothetical protein
MITTNDLLTLGFEFQYEVKGREINYETYTKHINGLAIEVTTNFDDKSQIVEITQKNGFSELKINNHQDLCSLINLLK